MSCVICSQPIPAHHRRTRIFCSPKCAKRAEAARNRAYRHVTAQRLCGLLEDPKTKECADCNKPARYYEHRDYSKPLEVVPICAGCNRRRGPGKHTMEGIYGA